MNLYRSGQVNDGSLLDQVPIVHTRTFNPLDAFHPMISTAILRERLLKANGHADNLVDWAVVDGDRYPMNRAAFLMVDKWLAAIEADRSDAPLEVKVRQHKPAEAQDTCCSAGQSGAQCPEEFQYPKMVAGGPVAADIMKCQLKPIDWTDYGAVQFTQDQRQRLQQAFPEGVCEWSKPGIEQQPPVGRWLTFAHLVGGEPLGPEPKSTPVKP